MDTCALGLGFRICKAYTWHKTWWEVDEHFCGFLWHGRRHRIFTLHVVHIHYQDEGLCTDKAASIIHRSSEWLR